MKKLILLSSFLTFTTCIFSQDTIIIKEDKRIEAKIVKTYNAVVKYALFNDQEGATYLIPKENIKVVIYENGKVESFDPIVSNQDNVVIPEKIFTKVIRINPLATIESAIRGFFELDLQFAFYIVPKIAIPIEVDFFAGNGLIAENDQGVGYAIMFGIEAVPVTHRQKSGLYLNALVGFGSVFRIGGYNNRASVGAIGLMANTNIGYQLMTKKGFVLNIAAGPMYSSLTKKITLRGILSLGFAF